MTFKERYELAENNSDFQWRCEVAASLAAMAVQNEDPAALTPPPGHAPPNASTPSDKKQSLHNTRSILARDILRSPKTFGRLFASAIAADPNNLSITESSSDAAIYATALAVFNSLVISGNG